MRVRVEQEQEKQVEAIARLIDPFDVRRGRMVAKTLVENNPAKTNAAHVKYPFIKKHLNEENEEVLLKAFAMAPEDVAKAAEDQRTLNLCLWVFGKLKERGKENCFPAMVMAISQGDDSLKKLFTTARNLEAISTLYEKLKAKHNEANELFLKIVGELSREGISLLENETAIDAIVELAETHEKPVATVKELCKW